jgi:hypothetical protein
MTGKRQRVPISLNKFKKEPRKGGRVREKGRDEPVVVFIDNFDELFELFLVFVHFSDTNNVYRNLANEKKVR